MEIWKPVVGYEGAYEVSNRGRVRSLNRVIVSRHGDKKVRQRVKGRMLRPSVCKFGYHQLQLSKRGRRTNYHVHVLVLTAFRGPPPTGMECLHGDGNPVNNRLKNLRWGTVQQNAADRTEHGNTAAGEAHVSAKLTDESVRYIRRKYAGGRTTKTLLARKFGVTPTRIGQIIGRKAWKHVL